MRISSVFLLMPLTIAAVLAGCVAPPADREVPPPSTPVPPAPPPPPPPPAADWRDRPVTPGTWRYERDGRGSRAMYGLPNREARLVLRCELPARRMFLSRAGNGSAPLTVRTSSVARTLAARPTGGEPPYVAVELPTRDPLLDAMAFSRGRFAIEQAGMAPLVAPSWAEIGRVIEDCRG